MNWKIGLAATGGVMALAGVATYMYRKQKGEVMELFGLEGSSEDFEAFIARMRAIEEKNPELLKQAMAEAESKLNKASLDAEKEEFKKKSSEVMDAINTILASHSIKWLHIRPERIPDKTDAQGKPEFASRLIAFKTQDDKTWGSFGPPKQKHIDTAFVPGSKRVPVYEEISDADLEMVERHVKKQKDVESRGGKYPLETRLVEAFANQGKTYSPGRIKGIIKKWKEDQS